MKRKSLILILGILFITALLSFASIPAMAEIEVLPMILIYGDLNFDFVCDSADYNVLNKLLLGKIVKPENPYYEKYADLNVDRKIDTADYSILRKYLIGVINTLPYTNPTITPTVTITGTPTIAISITPTPTTANLEIERKFLIKVDKIPYDLNTFDKYALTQAYICFSPEIRVRKANDDMFFLSIKTPVDSTGLVRQELEYFITEEEYLNLFKKKEGNVINKDRYQGIVGKYVYAIDIYSGMFEGLAVLEVEFGSEEEADSFGLPSWVEKDVTSDKRFKNGNLKNGLGDIQL